MICKDICYEFKTILIEFLTEIFSNKEDFQKMKTFLDNTRAHLNNNNLAIKEGVSYGLVKFKPITILQSQSPELRKLNLNKLKTKRIKRRRKWN